MSKLLTVNELCTSFFTKFGEVKAVDHVSFELDKGEVLAIVGESGSGKSVTSMSIMGLVAKGGKIISGEIIFEDEDLAKKSEKELSLEELKEQYFIPIYKKANDMIKRYGDVYERIS